MDFVFSACLISNENQEMELCLKECLLSATEMALQRGLTPNLMTEFDPLQPIVERISCVVYGCVTCQLKSLWPMD